ALRPRHVLAHAGTGRHHGGTRARARGGRGARVSAGSGRAPVVVVIGRYPLVTTTFIDREIAALRRRGLDVDVVALRRPPDDMPLSDEQRELGRRVEYVLPVRWWHLPVAHATFVATRPRGYARTFRFLVTRPHPDLRA